MTTLAPIGQLDDSAPILDDPAALQKRWETDGYLFFKGVLDVNEVEKFRRIYLAQLEAMGMIAPGADFPVWTGVTPEDPAHCIDIEDDLWRGFVAQPNFDSLVRRVLGEEPSWVPIVAPRASLPIGPRDKDDPFVGRHQDGYFNAGIDFRICWVPLMDIDQTTGGLAVAAGSHKRGYLHDEQKPPLFPIPNDSIPAEAWRRADYHQGDVLMFSYMTAHTGLANSSDAIRLSIDVRVLPASARQPVVGEVLELNDTSLIVQTESGRRELAIDDETYVRGIKGDRLATADLGTVLKPGTAIIAGVDDEDHAEVVRPSR